MNSKSILVVALICFVSFYMFLIYSPFLGDYIVWDSTFSFSTSLVQSVSTESDITADILLDSYKTNNFSETSDSISNDTDLMVSSFFMKLQPSDLPMCPASPPSLVGPIRVWLDAPSLEEIAQLYHHIHRGGHGYPLDCLARHRVAIIIPYRDRPVHLQILLHNLHFLFNKQQLDYAFFVVEQKKNQTFNRAKLMNVGFVEASKLYDWQCFVFHDVDLLPEDDRNLYSCPSEPRHMSVAIDKFQYKLPYHSIFGGISALLKTHFEKINGFSNSYWGWGGEDDDLSTRVRIAGFRILRYPKEIARYKMVKHGSEKENPVNPCRYNLMYATKRRWKYDGISSLTYRIISIDLMPLYTHIIVDLLESESRKDLQREGFKDC